MRELILFCLATLAVAAPQSLPKDAQNAANEPASKLAWGVTTSASGNESWGYVTVRPQANMFWWLYKTSHPDGPTNRPLIMWLQGGPGGSSCGFGNFELIGPLYINQTARETTWVKQANVLFVDNPVGTGYSYVTDDSAYTTNNDEIATDLVTLTREFFNLNPELKTVPFYIFGQSYGGKMAAAFAQKLYNEIQAGRAEANLAGFAMGNAWIHPVDSTLSWAPFLYANSLVDENCLGQINETAQLCKQAADRGEWVESTQLWRATQSDVNVCTNFVDFYNILRFRVFSRNKMAAATGYNLLMEEMNTLTLDELMNGPIREKLGVIPPTVTWGGQSRDVFFYQEGDFMKDVTGIVSDILTNTELTTIVYQGQLDLICDNIGAMDFVNRFQWPGKAAFYAKDRVAITNPADGQTENAVKANGRFKYYWVMRGGHSVAKDVPFASYRMLERILADTDV